MRRTYERFIPCEACDGSGFLSDDDECHDCKGTGEEFLDDYPADTWAELRGER